jgi:hypothetical protein
LELRRSYTHAVVPTVFTILNLLDLVDSHDRLSFNTKRRLLANSTASNTVRSKLAIQNVGCLDNVGVDLPNKFQPDIKLRDAQCML